MYASPPGSRPQSNTSMMPAWRIALAARASWKKRSMSVASRADRGKRTFTAAGLPSTTCSARYTLPIPPSPIGSSKRYLPT